ncbi:MAG: DUF1028 domain-containing protein [Verrucomicrobia bacterium]|nr:DUF1028 domain-containing protein [Verrucomicrobiota bacterium]
MQTRCRRTGLAWALVTCVRLLGGESVGVESAVPAVEPPTDPIVATFSIVGFDPDTGDLGVAVQSKFFGVGTVVPWARAGLGAIATQSYANISYGVDGLASLARGLSARETLNRLTAADEGRERRQAGIVDARGRVAAYTGSVCNPWAGHFEGTNFCAQGNILAGEEVVKAMATAFVAARAAPGSELADWLMAALAAGQGAGGDTRGQQSAALLVVRARAGYDGKNDRYIDLRVEDHAQPITELQRLLEIHKRFYRHAHENRPARANREPTLPR